MKTRISRPKALFFTLMENLSLFEEVIDAALESGQTRIGLWGAYFLADAQRFFNHWLRWPWRRADAERVPTPLPDVLRQMIAVLQCPLSALSPDTDAHGQNQTNIRPAPSPVASKNAERVGSAWRMPPPPPFPRKFLLAFARRRLLELAGEEALAALPPAQSMRPFQWQTPADSDRGPSRAPQAGVRQAPASMTVPAAIPATIPAKKSAGKSDRKPDAGPAGGSAGATPPPDHWRDPYLGWGRPQRYRPRNTSPIGQRGREPP
ncbi:MAG: hypothetical protein IPK79_08185 [Vampirovibrionales bacterium]|nr:hypothetical protein [Vampirovibrionales bacterium]